MTVKVTAAVPVRRTPSQLKQTEAGVIPEDWDVRPLSGWSEKITVGIASAATYAYRDIGVPLLRNQNIKPGYLLDDDILHVDPAYEKRFLRKRLKAGDVLTARTGYPGMSCVVPPKYAEAQSFTTLITRPKQDDIDSRYLCQYINSEPGRAFFEANKIGGAQKNINAGLLKKMPIPAPRLAEQRAIAGALADVDALIGALGKLIGKKRAIKLGTMQQLLSGKIRLPGFTATWSPATVGDLGEFRKGRGIKRDDVTGDGVPCVRYGEIYTTYDNYTDHLISRIPRAIAATALPIHSGDLVFTGSGETAEEIGKCVAYVGTEDAYAGGDTIVLSPTSGDPIFLAHLMNHQTVVAQKARLGQGDAVVHINARNLASIGIMLPDNEEQRGIGRVLTDLDAEIKVLEGRRKKTQAVKQGMMQALLTGRVRLA